MFIYFKLHNIHTLVGLLILDSLPIEPNFKYHMGTRTINQIASVKYIEYFLNIKSMKNKTRTILFAVLLVGMILPFSAMMIAEASTVPLEKVSNKAIKFGKLQASCASDDKGCIEDEIGLKMFKLKIDNQKLKMIKKQSVYDKIFSNNKKFDLLNLEMKKIKPDLPIAVLSVSFIKETNLAMDRLIDSGLPILMLNVNDSTGIFEIEIDLDRAEPKHRYDEEILEIIGNDEIQTEITYAFNNVSLQSDR